MLRSFLELGLNLYDVRKKCDRARDGDLCYQGILWVQTWMNDPKNKKALGVNPSATFESCNMQVNQDFAVQGDGMRNSAALLTDIINDGVRLLVYAGNAGKLNHRSPKKYVLTGLKTRCVISWGKRDGFPISQALSMKNSQTQLQTHGYRWSRTELLERFEAQVVLG
jgi:carboxypeptidase C (cathepsin A)